MQAQFASNWPQAPVLDPYFYDVSLLLNGDGTNGAQNNTFLDSSTNNFTITRNGNTTQGSFSPYGSLWSNYFNGTGYLNAGSSSNFAFGTGAYTVEMWVNPSAISQQVYLFNDSTGGFGFYFETSGSAGFTLASRNGSPIITGGYSALTLGAWNHIVVVRSSTSSNATSIFVNGTRVANGTDSTNWTITGPCILGGLQANAYQYAGYISNCRIVNGSAVYSPSATTITVPIAPLTAITNTTLLTCQSNRFIDNSTTAATIAPSSGNQTVQRFSPFNPTAPYSTSVIGGSSYMNVNGDFLTSPQSTNTDLGSGNFTIEAWTYATSVGAYYNFLIGKWNYPNKEWFLQYTASSINFYLSTDGLNDSTVFTASTTVPLNAWNHIAVTRSGSNLYIFLNGNLISTQSITQTFYAASQVVAIGNFPSGGLSDTNMHGYVSDARVVVGTALYTSSFTPPTAPLTAVSGTQLLLSYTNAGIPDLAMQNNLQTVGNAQVSTSVKKYGTGSLSFSGGSGDYLCNYTQQAINATNFGTGDFTIECWIYFNSTSGDQGIIDDASNLSSAGTQKWFLHKDGSQNLLFGQHSVGNILSYSWSPSTGTWYYITITRASGTAKMFINGTSVATASNSTNFASSGGVQVGIFASGNSLNGYIDDLRITNGYARYTANFTPPTSTLPTF
jgi:hypothetical protein